MTEDAQGALAYVRQHWAAFEDLSPRIIDLQHRAAVASYELREAGKYTQADAAREVIEQLAKLQRVHHSIVTWAANAADVVGLGVVQIPIGIAGVSIAALLMVWVFRKYAAQERALDLLEAGVLTPEQFRELDIMDPPGIGSELGEIAGGVGKWALLVIGALVLLEVARSGRFFQRNPPLILFGNPPGQMSEDVVMVAYKHSQDGEYYIHEFEGGVEMDALEDGTLAIAHPDHEVWREFEE